MVRVVFEPPLKEIYFHGPRFNGWGFWNGLPLHDICAQITHTSHELWLNNNFSQCIALTDRYFEAFYVGVYTVVYVFLLYNVFTYYNQMSLLKYQFKLLARLQTQQQQHHLQHHLQQQQLQTLKNESK